VTLASNDHVRLALPAEASGIAAVQRRVWAEGAGQVGAWMLDTMTIEEMQQLWDRALTAPPAARYRVLVALTNDRIVGFATTGPSADPDADAAADGSLEELAIDPPARLRGHGSRLLNAAVDTLRADGFRYGRCWVATKDDDVRRFLTGAGWAADGATREIGTDDAAVRLKQVRLHTDLRAEPSAELGADLSDAAADPPR
jgi:GNAT superfamily N-acetyltransferase